MRVNSALSLGFDGAAMVSESFSSFILRARSAVVSPPSNRVVCLASFTFRSIMRWLAARAKASVSSVILGRLDPIGAAEILLAGKQLLFRLDRGMFWLRRRGSRARLAQRQDAANARRALASCFKRFSPNLSVPEVPHAVKTMARSRDRRSPGHHFLHPASIPGLDHGRNAILGRFLRRRRERKERIRSEDGPSSGSTAFSAPNLTLSTRLIWPAPTPTIWPARA
jgi:hypothetical protein